MNSMQIKRWLVLSLLLWFSINGCSSLPIESPRRQSEQAIEHRTSDQTATKAGLTKLNRPETSSIKLDDQPPPTDEAATPPNSEAEPEASPTSTLTALIEDLKTTVMLESGIPSSELLVQETEAMQWSNSCLDAPRPDEVCAQVITPGYRIVLSDLTTAFEFHTDRTGRFIRQVQPQLPN